ncbi:MAG: hypothetical protein WA773_00760, partial [Bradyrhizobium sp.]
VLGTQIGEGEFCAATAPVSMAFVPERVAADEGCGRGKQHSVRKSPSFAGPPVPTRTGDRKLHCTGQRQICILFSQKMISF